MKLTNVYFGDGNVSVAVVEGQRALVLRKYDDRDVAFASMAQWLRAGEQGRQRTLGLLEEARAVSRAWQTPDSLRYAPLVDRDCRIFCVGLNYADHAAENDIAPPASPVFFSKLASTAIAHDDAVRLPEEGDETDYEAEFAFVVGRKVKHVSAEAASEAIAGYTIMNDVSARDMQARDGQWFRGKNCDTFAPLGPWLVTADEIAKPANLKLQMRLNGRVRQDSNTSNLVFSPPVLLSYLAQSLTIEPGDIISTGTPGGIGFYSSPKVFLQPGDVMEVEIENIGILRNTVTR